MSCWPRLLLSPQKPRMLGSNRRRLRRHIVLDAITDQTPIKAKMQHVLRMTDSNKEEFVSEKRETLTSSL